MAATVIHRLVQKVVICVEPANRVAALEVGASLAYSGVRVDIWLIAILLS